jgi:hypothetical protein
MNLKFSHILIGLVLLTFSCKKDDDTTPPPPTTTKSGLYFQFNHKYNSSNLELDKTYSDDFGNKITFTRVTFYLSQPILVNTNGDTLTAENNHFLVFNNTTSAFIGDYANTTLKSVTLNIGVDEENNHADPATYPLNHPLAFQSPSMHWDWNPGYLFIVTEGTVDIDGDGKSDETFTFHLGLDKYLNTVKKTDYSIILSDKETSFIVLEVDYKKLFTGINLSTENSTHSFNNTELADKFNANVTSAFILK